MINKKYKIFMKIAKQIALMSSCKSRQIGAVLTRENMIISTGYNGTPKGILNCNEGGCIRCNSKCKSGENLDRCICVHAEQNTIVQAAYNGISTKDSILFSTVRPCNECLKILINGGVKEIYYIEDYSEIVNQVLLNKIKFQKLK